MSNEIGRTNNGGSSSTRPWNFYTSSDPGEFSSPPRLMGMTNSYNRPDQGAAGPWKQGFGIGTTTSTMSAISFGFVATAILISMFLIMAILEHLFRPSNDQDEVNDSLESGSSVAKSTNQDMVMTRYSTGLSVVMPGQKYPTCIAQPAPLVPFTREGIHWPPHHHTCDLS